MVASPPVLSAYSFEIALVSSVGNGASAVSPSSAPARSMSGNDTAGAVDGVVVVALAVAFALPSLFSATAAMPASSTATTTSPAATTARGGREAGAEGNGSGAGG